MGGQLGPIPGCIEKEHMAIGSTGQLNKGGWEGLGRGFGLVLGYLEKV